jgi:FKBP-type peptidyl-prolyl cis-trans isomerase 2
MCTTICTQCAKEPEESWTDNELMIVKATIKTYFPKATPLNSDSSLWLLEHRKREPNTGATPQPDNYVLFGYRGELLPISRSTIFQTTDSLDARLLNTFAYTTHYAPIFSLYNSDYMQPAVFALLSQMHEGDTATVLSASWHAFGSTGATGVAANTPVIVTLALKEVVPDAAARDSLLVLDYVAMRNASLHPDSGFVPAVDTAGQPLNGIFVCYADTVPPTDSTGYASTSEVLNLEYAGYFLDGFLLDSNIGKVSHSFSWDTTATTNGTKYTAYYAHTFSKAPLETTSIKAFDVALLNVAEGSWVEVVFTSAYGYGSTGSTTTAARIVYPYTPLRFRIRFVSIKE